MERPAWAPPEVDLDKPSLARAYDYYLGGSHNLAADRALADEVVKHIPDIPLMVRANRAFYRRVVRHIAGQGVRQFLDVGSGIPTVDNTHEIAQEVEPEARVVYVEVDPTAIATGRAILAGNPGAVMVEGDVRKPEALLADPEVRGLLDLDQPVAVLMIALLNLVLDEEDPEGILARYREALAPGSYLVVSHGSSTPEMDKLKALYEQGGMRMQWRDEAAVGRLLTGFTLVEPGIVPGPRWRPDPGDEAAEPVWWWSAGTVAVGRLD